MPVLSANGSKVHVLVKSSIIHEGGQITGMSGIVRNPTPVASLIAFSIAGAGPSCGSSPMPLAPNAPY